MKQLEKEIDYLFSLALVDFDNEMAAAGLEVPRDAAIDHLQKFIQSQISQAEDKIRTKYATKISNYLNEIAGLKAELSQQRQEAIEEFEKKIKGMEKLPYHARLCQNRNGMDYCGTCEQAWEVCSCSARNSGYKKCVEDILALLDKLEEEK